MSYRRLTKDQAKAALLALVEKYQAQRTGIEAATSNYTETEARGEFIDPFLGVFGWDVHNAAGVPQSQREVILEHAANPETYVIGRPDFRLRVRGRDRLPVEAKKPSVRLAGSAKSSLQARSYGWSLSLPAAVLTNFGETVIFDARVDPQEGQDADVGVIPGLRIGVDEYVEKFDTLWAYLAFEQVSVDDSFNQLHHYETPPRGASPFDKTFLNHFRAWRLDLASDIARENTQLGAAEVGRRAQRLLNALLFLRVCEDRDIWQYERLLAYANNDAIIEAFSEADRVFNAGLFTVLDTTNVSASTLRKTISELYWPQTKFAFGVMRPEVLAELYEQYLAERVEVAADRTVALVEKPELTHSGGVVPTPQFIVDSLCTSGFTGMMKAAEALPDDLTILDPACGSGVFLLAAFERLLEHAELIGDSTLASRAALAKKHIFGVDIDGEAVEVTRLSLLLAVLGDAQVDTRTETNVLPDLSKNIAAGNAIVSDDFDLQSPAVAAIPTRRAAVSPFSWKTFFPEAMAAGGFSLILANPPYVRIQTMQKYLADHLEYLQNAQNEYGSAQSFNFDLYMIFIERSVELLKPGGRMAMIVPNRFTNGLAGSTVRKVLGERIERLVHFGELQVFPGRTTYTALIIAGDPSKSDAVFELVTDLDAWKEGRGGTEERVERATLTAEPWPIATAARTEIFNRMIASARARLGDPDWMDIFVGVQTSADDIYFIDPHDEQPHVGMVSFTDHLGKVRTIEQSITRASLKDKQLRPYDRSPEPDRLAIFPYAIEPPSGNRKNPRARVFIRDEMERLFPKALEYFEAHRAALESRAISPDPGSSFWAYGRSQSLTKLDAPKIVVRTLSINPQYVSDPDGLLVPGGGDGGPYYLLRAQATCPYPESVMIALLSHPATDAFVASRGKAYRGSYVVHRKAFLKEIPIPPLTPTSIEEIDRSVVELQEINNSLRTETDSAIVSTLNQRSVLLRGLTEQRITEAFGLTTEDMAIIVG